MWGLVPSSGAREHNRCARYHHHHNTATPHHVKEGEDTEQKTQVCFFCSCFSAYFLHGWFGKTITTEKASQPTLSTPDLITSHLHYVSITPSPLRDGRPRTVWRLPDNKQSNSLIKINPFLICKICQTVGNGNFSEIGNIYPLRKASASMTHNSLY